MFGWGMDFAVTTIALTLIQNTTIPTQNQSQTQGVIPPIVNTTKAIVLVISVSCGLVVRRRVVIIIVNKFFSPYPPPFSLLR